MCVLRKHQDTQVWRWKGHSGSSRSLLAPTTLGLIPLHNGLKTAGLAHGKWLFSCTATFHRAVIMYRYVFWLLSSYPQQFSIYGPPTGLAKLCQCFNLMRIEPLHFKNSSTVYRHTLAITPLKFFHTLIWMETGLPSWLNQTQGAKVEPSLSAEDSFILRQGTHSFQTETSWVVFKCLCTLGRRDIQKEILQSLPWRVKAHWGALNRSLFRTHLTHHRP